MKTAVKIKVVGVGGSGSNTISRMAKSKIKGVELVAINTDGQDLGKVHSHYKIRIGRNLTKGLGTGMSPEIGKKAAEEQKEEISKILKDSDMIFVACGLGGGTGSGASPVVAEIAKNSGALTIGIITKPFSFEGLSRMRIAERSQKLLKKKVDALLVIQNDKLLEILEPNTTILNAFWMCDDILRQAVQGISDLVSLSGIINVDFANVKTIMKNSGTALFGIGKAKGEGRAERAALAAINSPLLNLSLKGAKGILFNISGGRDISLSEIDEISRIFTEAVSPEAKIVFGAVYDEKLKKGELKVTVIATGF